MPKQLLIGYAIAIGSTSCFSQDSLTVEVGRIITHFRCELVTQQGKWPLPIGRIRQEAFMRYGQFNGRVSVSRGTPSGVVNSLRTLLLVNPVRVNWQPNGYSGLPIGEKSYSRIHRSQSGTWVLVVHAILDDVLVTTSCTTFRGHRQFGRPTPSRTNSKVRPEQSWPWIGAKGSRFNLPAATSVFRTFLGYLMVNGHSYPSINGLRPGVSPEAWTT